MLRLASRFSYSILASLPLLLNAQAHESGPLLLLLPAGPRAAAFGNAWVVGRDENVVFSNPSLINATTGFGISYSRYDNEGQVGTFAYGTTVGRFTFGVGARTAVYSPSVGAGLPFEPAELLESSDRQAMSVLTAVGMNMTYAGNRVGITAKYAEDRVTYSGSPATLPRQSVFYADFGLSRPFLNGTFGFAIQNIGSGRGGERPAQTSLGWTRARILGEFDLVVAGAVTIRDYWVSPGGGVELGYGWIEGWSTAFRLGARKTETDVQKPISAGWTLNADRLGLDYAVELFEGDRLAHHLSLRWR
ncbi:MAG TPA: hypothetical protein VJR92_02125 [Gemmatimonadaceae bacterium]|nr:hypothetical protein [Gemmatimonadaceae bacterium]